MMFYPASQPLHPLPMRSFTPSIWCEHTASAAVLPAAVCGETSLSPAEDDAAARDAAAAGLRAAKSRCRRLCCPPPGPSSPSRWSLRFLAPRRSRGSWSSTQWVSAPAVRWGLRSGRTETGGPACEHRSRRPCSHAALHKAGGASVALRELRDGMRRVEVLREAGSGGGGGGVSGGRLSFMLAEEARRSVVKERQGGHRVVKSNRSDAPGAMTPLPVQSLCDGN